MNWLEEWFEKAKNVILNPTKFYEDVEEKGNYKYPVKFAVTSGIISAILTYSVKFLRGIAGVGPWRLIPVAVFAGILAGTIGLFLSAGVLHIFVYLLGGRGFQKTTEAISYSTAVDAFFGWIPYIGIIVWIYTLYVRIRSLERYHEFTTARAAAAVLIPVAILITVVIVILAILFSLFAVSFQQYLAAVGGPSQIPITT